MESITIPDSVDTIWVLAFAKCSFSSIRIPKSASFGGNPFSDCLCLEEIAVSENSNFVFVDGVFMDKKTTQIINCDPFREGDYAIQDMVITVCACTFYECDSLEPIMIT